MKMLMEIMAWRLNVVRYSVLHGFNHNDFGFYIIDLYSRSKNDELKNTFSLVFRTTEGKYKIIVVLTKTLGKRRQLSKLVI